MKPNMSHEVLAGIFAPQDANFTLQMEKLGFQAS